MPSGESGIHPISTAQRNRFATADRPRRLTHRLVIAATDISLVRTFPLWPLRFKPRKHSSQVFLGVGITEAGHVALVTAANHRRRSACHDVEQNSVGMVPGVTVFVMWRRRQSAIRSGRAPVLLTFQIGAVAGCAGFSVDRGSARELH